MVQMQTILKVADNSGGKFVKCIRVLKKGSFSRSAKLGDLIVVSVQKLREKNKFMSKVKKGDVVYALVSRLKVPKSRPTGYNLSFGSNSVVLMTKSLKPIGTRVFGVLPQELRTARFSKILSLASKII